MHHLTYCTLLITHLTHTVTRNSIKCHFLLLRIVRCQTHLLFSQLNTMQPRLSITTPWCTLSVYISMSNMAVCFLKTTIKTVRASRAVSSQEYIMLITRCGNGVMDFAVIYLFWNKSLNFLMFFLFSNHVFPLPHCLSPFQLTSCLILKVNAFHGRFLCFPALLFVCLRERIL